MKPRKIEKNFYLSEDVVSISRALIGKFLVTHIHHQKTAGMIVETEAYKGAEDKASHAYGYRRTERTRIMYAQGGVAYIYLCYGIHHLFNIVTAGEGIPHAVLIRAIVPVDGIPIMLKRRRSAQFSPKLTAGPGTLSEALGIHKQWNGTSLLDTTIWVEDRGIKIAKKEIIASPRVGIDYAEEHRDLPWRFRLRQQDHS